MSGTVTDLKTRKPFQIEPYERDPTEAERVAKFIEGCGDRMWADAMKLRAVAGLDAALTMLGKIADDLRNQGRVA